MDDEWCDFDAAEFHAMEAVDAELSARLSTRFQERLVTHMTPSERTYADGWPPPRFEVGVTPKGERVLAVVFGGGRSVTDWDGSEADAAEIVESCADTSAVNSEWDYWVQDDGWKEWRGR
jgi:hypothetical protein